MRVRRRWEERKVTRHSAAGVNAALRRYEATRKPRATQIQGNSSKNNWMREATDPTWVYGYDAWSTPLLDPAN